jgi:hypothetical protein
MGELVNDQAVEQIGRLVERHHDAVTHRLGEGTHAFLRRSGNHVLLLELAAGLEQDERNLEGEVVFQLRADLLVRAFGVASHPLQVLLDLGVVIDLEVVRRIDLPLEVVVADLVLPVVRDVRRLRRGEAWRQQECRHERRNRDLAHRILLAGYCHPGRRSLGLPPLYMRAARSKGCTDEILQIKPGFGGMARICRTGRAADRPLVRARPPYAGDNEVAIWQTNFVTFPTSRTLRPRP